MIFTITETILLASIGILASAYIVADYRRLQRWIYILKPLTMLMIIAVALTANSADGQYQLLIVTGLLFSLAGDSFLMLPSDHFLHGLIAFFLAHLLYIAAFVGVSGSTGGWWIAVALGLLAVLVYRQLQSGLGALKAAVALYMMIIVIMGWRAWEVWLTTGQAAGLVVAAGATLFIISDTALAFERFGKPYVAARGLIMSTYFGGQLLIALSV